MASAPEESAATADRRVSRALGTSTNDGRRAAPERPRQALLGDVRTRILISFFILLVVSTAVSLLVLREVLLSRIGDDARGALTAQVGELRTLAATGTDPETQ